MPHRALFRLSAVALAAAAIALPLAAQDGRMPLFDAHIHYSHDAVALTSPEQAIAILRKAGLKRALVSSSDDRGTQLLLALAPDLIIPSLRPYRTRGDVGSWVRDNDIIQYVEGLLAKNKYAAFGEFHVYGGDADLPVVRRMVELAKQHHLVLHAHSDSAAIDLLFKQNPQARILWAHSGFDRPERVREMLKKYPTLWCDLAFLSGHYNGDKVDPEWRKLFGEFPDRFMLGTDSFTPERWHYIGEHADTARRWLADLPRDLAERIGYKNADILFADFKPTAK